MGVEGVKSGQLGVQQTTFFFMDGPGNDEKAVVSFRFFQHSAMAIALKKSHKRVDYIAGVYMYFLCF